MAFKFENLGEMIQYLDAKAVEHALKVYPDILDHSVQSVKVVENILTRLHNHYTASQSKSGMFGMTMFYGAYIGEVIRKENKLREAAWEGDTSGQSFPSLRWRARHGGHSTVFPMSWCYARIINGPEENVWVKYQFCVSRDNAVVEHLGRRKLPNNS